MMDFSERSAYVGTNIKPTVKHSILEHLKAQKEQGNKISMSRWIEEAIDEKIARDGIPILTLEETYTGEPLPFDIHEAKS